MHRLGLLLIVSFIISLGLKGQNGRFYSPSDGLSGTSIHGVFQDSRGYIWIPLFSSLNRFDGYSFTVFEHKGKDSTSINSTYVNVVFEDSIARLWIGTDKGLNLFNYEKNCFQDIRLGEKRVELFLNVKWIIEDNSQSLWLTTSRGLVNFNPVTRSCELYNHRFQSNGAPYIVDYNQSIIDKKGNIWIGTASEGVLVFDVRKHRFYTIREYTGIDYNLPDRTVMAVHQTKTGQILIGMAREGIVVYDPEKGTFNQIKNSGGKEGNLDRGILSIMTDKKGTIWIGTEGNGVKTCDLIRNTLTDVSYLIDLPGAAKSRIFCYEDKQGDMWFGIMERGIYLKILSSKNFHVVGNSKKGEQLSHYLISSVMIDRNGNKWMGTEGGGINILWKGETHFKIFDRTKYGVTIKDKTIEKLYEDRRGWVWIGTYYEGLYCYKGKDQPLQHYNIPGYERDAKRNYILDIQEDSRGNLWIGSKGGLFYFEVDKGIMSDAGNPIVSGKTETIDPNIYALEYGADSTLWIATVQGLFAWNSQKEIFHSFQMSKGDLANDLVTCLKKDNEGNMWIGTLSGLYRYIPEKLILQRYGTEDGLCSNSIKAIETDIKNQLWVSTTAGISKFDSKAAVFSNYFVSDGLPCDKYFNNASFKDSKGNIYFGGVDGLVYFNPDSISDQQNKPNLIFTSFKIFNQEVNYNPQNPENILKKDINATDTILFNYASKSFTIEFAAINFSAPEKIKYAVKMEGFDPNWQYKDNKHRYATYTNLAPGTYFLHVKSTDLEGLWPGSQRTLCIVVSPPLWLTWWAFLIYVFILLCLSYYIRKIALFRINIKNQLHLEHVEREKLEEINQSKMQFFTNVSHEIRTPLTMILAPLERLMGSDLNESHKKNINYVYKNTKRIERIVNQLLELQKIENTQLRLKAQEIDLVKFLHQIISLFEETANDQKIHLSFEPNCEELKVWIDPEKMDKVIFNLISNALKFTSMEGLITVSIKTNHYKHGEDNFVISISDTGSGMDQIHLSRIFDRFYQIEDKTPGQTIGFGIGLHLSRELIEKQHGIISLTSKENFGSTFIITMPLGRNHLRPDEILEEQPFQTIYSPEGRPDIMHPQFPVLEKEIEGKSVTGRSLILLVEDDMDILKGTSKNYFFDAVV
jgi:signal transduction histidine kinase/ligand-binding sensor domain-containing protein